MVLMAGSQLHMMFLPSPSQPLLTTAIPCGLLSHSFSCSAPRRGIALRGVAEERAGEFWRESGSLARGWPSWRA